MSGVFCLSVWADHISSECEWRWKLSGTDRPL